MRPPIRSAIMGLALCTLSCFVTDAWSQGRKKPHRASASESVELPDPSPGTVIEAGYQDDVGGAIEHRLGFLINVYAHGMQGYIRDAARGRGGLVSEPSMERFRQQLMRATFAYFEYSWQAAGIRHTRIYVSRSNQGFERLIPSGSSDLVAPGTTEADYLPDTGAFRFARNNVDVPGSSVHPSNDPLANRANDAELKILQTLKNDIHLNRQMAGGELIGFVSQRPCVSCSPALRRFASETGATVRVNYVDGENAEGRRTPLFQSMRQIREIAAALLVSYFNRPS
jgi:hypothetical protein